MIAAWPRMMKLETKRGRLAEALRMGKWGWQTISKWENGDVPVPGPAQIAIECLLERKAKRGRRDNSA